jgi:hypothetical protein
VSESEPYNSTSTLPASLNRPEASRAAKNFRQASIGPKVCELEGPKPTLNISNTLRMALLLLLQYTAYSNSKSNAYLCLIWNWNKRQDAAPKCEAFREARRDRVPPQPTNQNCMDAVLI